ncbi:MAG TPA: 3-phosphoshikimate 1-carboxyvinyltransferase [Methanoregulaceae archaeon]|nr:3-phosphoshikimate 1-carboxyvinyltransferase [Methanoregulaceae archaeon]
MEVVIKKAQGVDFSITAPPSKSYTHRALIAAALAEGNSRIINPLESEDISVTRDALRNMGIPVTSGGEAVFISGSGGTLRCPPAITLDMKNSGTSLRLLAAVALLCKDRVVLTGSQRMLERPVGPLVDALNNLGGSIRYLRKERYPPIEVQGVYRGGRTVVDGSISSQFISSLLLSGPCAEKDVEIILAGRSASLSYLDITVDVMKAFGADISRHGYTRFRVKSEKLYRGGEYAIEGDYSSSSYFFAIAAVCGGKVRVSNLNPDSCQGDRAFLSALEMMGCRISAAADGIVVEAHDPLEGIEIDMSASPDTVQTLCMVAAFARSKTRITGISHLRYKESDRIQSTADILTRMGAEVTVGEDSIIIHPSSIRGGTIDPGDDHRTAMSAAVLGLGAGNIKILNAGCVSKSYPGFWDSLRRAELI